MSNVGQVALTLAGAYVGGMVGMPGLGASLGNMLGQALFPTELPTNVGPQIADQKVTTSAIGAAWPWVFGQDVVAGNVLWKDEVKNHPHTTEAGGKGGPTQKSIHYTATVSYAVGLCYCYDAPIAGITRMWRNEKVVYDVRPQQEDETDTAYAERVAASEAYAEGFALYLGTADQLPDPTIEAVKGVGNTPAYRNRAYIVHIDEDVTDTNGAIPNRRYELVTAGDDATTTVIQYAAAVMEPWYIANDPRRCQNDHEYRADGFGTWHATLDEAIEQAVAEGEPADAFANFLGFSRDGRHLFRVYEEMPEEQMSLFLHFNKYQPTHATLKYQGDWGTGISVACGPMLSEDVTPGSGMFWWSGYAEDGGENVGAERAPGMFYLNAGGAAALDPDDEGVNNCTAYPGPGPSPQARVYRDRIIHVRRVPRVPAPPCTPRCSDPFPLLPENPNYCAIGGRVESMVGYGVASGSFKALANYRQDGIGVGPSINVTDYPQGPVVVSGSADDTQEAWEAAYASALLAGKLIRPGLVYGVDYPVVPTAAYIRSYQRYALQPAPREVGSIVRAICERVGVPADRIDVSDLTDTLPGYGLSTLMTARDGIQPLQAYQFFDCVESDALLKFPKRGKPIVLTLNSDDLGARFAGETAPPLVSTQIQQAVELPRFVRVHYKMGAKDYQPGMQQSPPRMTTDSVNAKDVQLAINMADDKAAQIAQVIHQDDWWGRETYETVVSPALLQLECADAIGIPVEGQVERARIVNVNMAPPFSPLKFALRRDDDGVYVSHSVGAAAVPSGSALGVAGPTSLLVIDGPALDGSANDAGVYVAAWGQFSRWSGAQVMRSTDAGASYKDVVTIVTPATVGRVVGVLPAGPMANVWDYASVLIVEMEQGVLSSSSEIDVLNGANPAFVGSDQRWEVVQYVDALLLGEFGGRKRYQITTLLRGRRGTEWAQSLHQEGDWFAAVGPGMARIPGDNSDLGRNAKWKAVTLDMMEETAQAQDLVMRGVALKPYSPCHVTAARDANNNIVFAFLRRTRLGGEWLDQVDVPLNEASEAYQLDVLGPDGAVLRTLASTVPSVAYPLANEVADFGNMTMTKSVAVYQMSATAGRGYAAFADLATPQTDTRPPAGTIEVEFGGMFSANVAFRVHLYYGASEYFYQLAGAGKSTLDEFADELAALVLADVPALAVEVDGATVTIVSKLPLSLVVLDNVLEWLSVEEKQVPRPVSPGVDVQTADFDLYYKSGDIYLRAPGDDARYDNSGPGKVYYQIYGATYAAQKALDAINDPGLIPLNFVAAARPSGTIFSGTKKGYTLQGLATAINAQATLQSLDIISTGISGTGHVQVECSGPYYLKDWGIESNRLAGQISSHPSGYIPSLTTNGVLPNQNTISYPSGAKQLTRVDFGWTTTLVEDAEFRIVLDGVPYVYTVTAGDVSADPHDFTPVYSGLKSAIEGTGDYAVSYYLYKSWMEIERNVIDTPFVVSASADLLAIATVTRL